MKQAPMFWENLNWLALLLWPLSFLFGLIVDLRRTAYEKGWLQSARLPVPVIVVGNIRIGGTGKTPIVIALAQELSKAGFRPGIISRGYTQSSEKNSASQASEVLANSNPHQHGDEPVLMAQLLAHLNIPVFISSNRVAAGQALLKSHPECNLIISDDGLQHYGLQRHPARNGGHDIEIVVRDARGEGNEFLLPAGPLREPIHRGRDATIQTGVDVGLTKINFWGAPLHLVQVKIGNPYQLKHPQTTQALESFTHQKVLAAAGLGHPQKFFDLLSQAGLQAKTLALPDHFSYQTNPFASQEFEDIETILVTQKDAVKCSSINESRIWVVPLEAKLPTELISWISSVVKRS